MFVLSQLEIASSENSQVTCGYDNMKTKSKFERLYKPITSANYQVAKSILFGYRTEDKTRKSELFTLFWK